MNSVDVKCPICGAMNESLNLEETDGWMECESCGNAVQIGTCRYNLQWLDQVHTNRSAGEEVVGMNGRLLCEAE